MMNRAKIFDQGTRNEKNSRYIDDETGMPKVPKGYRFKITRNAFPEYFAHVVKLQKLCLGFWWHTVASDDAYDTADSVQSAGFTTIKKHYKRLVPKNATTVSRGAYPPKKLDA